MVNYASNELNINNGNTGDNSVITTYDPKKAIPIDLSSDTLEVQKLKQHLPGRGYLEGVLINGFLCGPGKYYKDGQLEYEGIFIKDSLCGPGKKYKDGQLEYEGDFLNNLFYGNGTLYNTNGTIKYRGEFANGKFNGRGTLYDEYENIKYDGEFANGKFNGRGTLYYDAPRNKFNTRSILYSKGHEVEYRGEFANGQFNGKGILYSHYDELWYEGEFSNGRIHGKGEFLDAYGSRYKGDFINDHMIGPGQKITKNGEIIKGTFYTGSIKELLEIGKEYRFITPELKGPATVYFDGDLKGDYSTSYYVDNKATGKTYFYDCNRRLVLATEAHNKDLHRNGIEYKYTESERESREFRVENGIKKYISTEADGVASWTKEDSTYWDIIFNPLDNDKPKYLNKSQSYELMIDALKNKAHTEVNIISPWISNWTTHGDGEFLKALENALKRGINVKIITGLSNDKNNRYDKTQANIDRLKDIFKDYEENLSFKNDDTHEKMLLCDNDFMIYGSHNMLSCHPNYTNWEDSMIYFTDPNKIHESRKKYFNF